MNGRPLHSLKTYVTRNEWIVHVIFWLVYFGLNVLRWGSFFDDYHYSLKSNLVEFPIHIILVYLNIYILLPKLIPQRPFIYVISLFILMLILSFARIELTYWFVSEEVWMEIPNKLDRFNINYIIEIFIGELYVVGIITAVKLIIDNARNKQLNKELTMRGYETEIELLKSQIQPHFFFNTLNNLYSLTLEKSDKAPDLIIKLADMMKYLAYQSKKDRVPLDEEVVLINSFLELEKLRYGDRLKIRFNIEGGLTNTRIAPLVLFPFVQCVFKNETYNKLGKIDIILNLAIDSEFVSFTMENKKCEDNINDNIEKVIDLNKNGLKSTKRRLDLLYGKKYNLDIIDADNFYKLQLKLPYSND